MKKSLLFLSAALMCTAVNAQNVVFNEDFEGVTVDPSTRIGALPTGWTTYGDGQANYSGSQVSYTAFGDSWSVSTGFSNGNGTQTALSISWLQNPVVCDRWLITPAINIPQESPSGTTMALTFEAYSQDHSYTEDMMVKVSTTGTEKTDFTETLFNGNIGTAMTPAYDLSAYAGQTIYVAFVNVSNDKFILLLDNVKVAPVANNGVAIADVTAPNLAAMNSEFNVTVNVRNTGVQPLTSYDLSYTINGGSAQTINVTNENIAPSAESSYNLPLNIATAGAATIAVTVSNPNGEADVDASDNNGTATVGIYDPAHVAQRTTLLEHFTTGQCQYCPSGHERLEEAMTNYEDRVCWVSHHVGFGTDAMTLNESNQIAALYGTPSTWAPAMMLDRNVEYALEPEAGGVVGSVGYASDIISQLQAATSTPAFVTVNISDLNYNAQTRQLSVTVNGEFVGEFAGTEARLSLYLTEDSILGRQADAATQTYINNYVNNHVIRATLSNIWGDADAFTTTTAGSTYTKTFTYTLPTNFRANKCRLVAFVNDYGTDMLHRTVANAAKSAYLLTGADPTTTGIADVEANINIKTYPNPATEMAYISAESTIRGYKMVDAMGRVILSEENVNVDMLELDVRGLAQGVYFINVTTDNGVASQRLTVVK